MPTASCGDRLQDRPWPARAGSSRASPASTSTRCSASADDRSPPKRVRGSSLYGKPERIITQPSAPVGARCRGGSRCGHEAVRTACARGGFRPARRLVRVLLFTVLPRVRRRSDAGGAVMLARQAERERPAKLRSSSSGRGRAVMRRGDFPFGIRNRPGRHRVRSRASTARLPLSSPADHSLLWHACGARPRSPATVTSSSRRLRGGMGADADHQRRGQGHVQRVRPADYADIDFHHGLRRRLNQLVPSGRRDAAFLRGPVLRGGGWYGLATWSRRTGVRARCTDASDVAAGARSASRSAPCARFVDEASGGPHSAPVQGMMLVTVGLRDEVPRPCP